MSDFRTPGRQFSVEGSNSSSNNNNNNNNNNNKSGSGSAGRRVLRSALELLVETASPDLIRPNYISNISESNSISNSNSKSKFTVTHAAAPPTLATRSSVNNNQREQIEKEERWVSNASEEPSTLLFLSPSSTTGIRDSAVKKRLFKKKSKSMKLTDSAKKSTVKDMRHMMTAVGNKEKKEEELNKDKVDFTTKRGSGKSLHIHEQELVNQNEPLFTEKEVQQRIITSLKAYETSRDAEEESILQEVGREIESQNERYEKLLQEKQTISEERDNLFEKIEQLAMQSQVLQSTIANLHQELQEERTKANRVEVELCHAQDEIRLASSGMQQEINFEKAQWKLAQEEMKKQINEFEVQLKYRTSEWHEMQKIVDTKENERCKLAEELKACKEELQQCQKRNNEVQLLNTELQEINKSKESFILQLQNKLQDSEKAVKRVTNLTKEEHVQIESRLRLVEDALQQQTEEVRKKMHRIHVLETEQAKIEVTVKTFRRVIGEAKNYFSILRESLEELVEMCRVSSLESSKGKTRHIKTSQNGLRTALFSTRRRNSLDDSYIEKNENIPTNNSDNDEEEDDEEEDSLLGLVVHKELRNEIQKERLLFSEKLINLQKQQKEKQQLLRKKKPMTTSTIRKSVEVNTMEADDDCSNLQRCEKQCERLLETLQELILKGQKTVRTQFDRLQIKQAEYYKLELTRYHEALTTSQTELETMKQKEQLHLNESRQRIDEIRKLESTIVELRAAEQVARVQQKYLSDNVEELKRDRGLLNLQLEASQQNCVELRERYEASCAELAELQECLNSLEEKQHTREDADNAKVKALTKLARCTEKLKKVEIECQTLRDENEILSNKVKSMLLQLQTNRIHQRCKSIIPTAQKQQQEQQREELTLLTKELGALRGLQESAATLHAKERAEAETSMKKIRIQNEGLRDELSNLQRTLSETQNEAELQRRSEFTTLQTLMSIHQGYVSGLVVPSYDTDMSNYHGNDSEEVQQRLFDRSPTPHRKENIVSSNTEILTSTPIKLGVNELRGKVVTLAQRVVLELARLRESVQQQRQQQQHQQHETPQINNNVRINGFRMAEQLAWDAAQRSAARRTTFNNDLKNNNNNTNINSTGLPEQLSVMKQQQEQQQEQQCFNTIATPRRRSVSRQSPSPKETKVITSLTQSHPLPHSSSLPRKGGAPSSSTSSSYYNYNYNYNSSSLTSGGGGGVSRSRSGPGLVDGSQSPPRPPMLRAPSVR